MSRHFTLPNRLLLITGMLLCYGLLSFSPTTASAGAGRINTTIIFTGYAPAAETGGVAMECISAKIIVENRPYEVTTNSGGNLTRGDTGNSCKATFGPINLDAARTATVQVDMTGEWAGDTYKGAGSFSFKPQANVTVGQIILNRAGQPAQPAANPVRPRPTIPAPPAIPTNVKAKTINSNSIQITWSEELNQADKFLINDNKDSLGVWVPGDRKKNNFSYTVSGLAPGRQYCYRVSAMRNDVGRSVESEWACAYTSIQVTNAH
jgi:hypothetical protein